MSSASDLHAFEHSVEPSSGEVLFSGKKWTYIQDSTSNNGQYSGQIQLNLSTISSQAAFVNWQEAVIQLPVKLQILNGGPSSVTSTAAASLDQLVPKCGAWQFIDSISVVIDGVTVQTNQIHENVNAQLKALTEWTLQDERKYGATSQFSMDQYDPPISNVAQSLENMPTSQFMSATNNTGEFGLSNTFNNQGAAERALFTGVSTAAGTLAWDVAGSTANASAVSKPLVYTAPAGAVAAGSPFYIAHYIATIRLRDICDYFKKCPMSKNAKGFICLNYNSSSTTITTSAAGVVTPGSFAMQTNMNYGNTCPILYNILSATSAQPATSSGVTTVAYTELAVPSGTILTVTADINGTTTSGSGLTPSQPFSRLLIPTYMPNPTADHALVQKKSFRYFERMTNKFTVQPGQAFTYTLTNGIANPRKLFLCPVITNPTAGTRVSDVINPLRSPFSTVPATMSPFCSIKNLQVTVGNLPIWNNPVNFGFDAFVQELRAGGFDGNLDDDYKAGLLTQRQWESLYRFIPVKIGRRLPSEDGASKSIIATGTNNTAYALTIYYHIWRDAVATVDCAMGTVSQGATQV